MPRTLRNEIVLWAAAVAVALGGVPGVAIAHPPERVAAQTYQPSGVWEWQENVLTDRTAQAAFFAFAGTHGVTSVYIECESAIQNDQPALIAFLQAAAARGIATELLFGDPRWVLPGQGYPHQGYAISLVATYAAQLLAQMKTGQPLAVHFDVEPYALPLWRKDRNALALDYVDLVTKLASAAHPLGLTLSVDVPYWYSTIPVTHGTQTTSLNELVIDAVDRYVIMDYWDTAARIERQAATDLGYANGIAGKQVLVAVLTTCGQKPADTSFCHSGAHAGTAWMETVLGAVTSAEAANPSFAGLAIEDYAGFRRLGP